jgi:hypothetical protein
LGRCPGQENDQQAGREDEDAPYQDQRSVHANFPAAQDGTLSNGDHLGVLLGKKLNHFQP